MPTRALAFVCAFCLVSLGVSRAKDLPATAREEPPSFFQYFPHVSSEFCGPFLDSFDDPAPGWFLGSYDGLSAEIVESEYRLAFTGRGAVWLVPGPLCPRMQYKASVDARWAGETGNFIGLLVGFDVDRMKTFLFAVNTDERVWLVFEVRNNSLDTIIAPVGHEAVLPGNAVNRLAAERRSDTIVLSINDVPVGELRDTNPGYPVIAGVAAASYTFQSSADARFDNFRYDP